MLGAIAGDIIGSIYEFNNIKTTEFPLFSPGCSFTDDTVLTVVLADCILHGGGSADRMKEYYALYPNESYGARFQHWAQTGTAAYNSFGNGAAMRISPAGVDC
ncbi:MAG TPA: ADP-ribosylglycohydrolase family protein [Planctomycetota bacterium]|nr:ADP-ribosylglycohydrolase family protein [Planctomycetota bacterium]